MIPFYEAEISHFNRLKKSVLAGLSTEQTEDGKFLANGSRSQQEISSLAAGMLTRSNVPSKQLSLLVFALCQRHDSSSTLPSVAGIYVQAVSLRAGPSHFDLNSVSFV